MPKRDGLLLPKRDGLRLPQRKGARFDNSSITFSQGRLATSSGTERLPQRNGVARTKRSIPSSSSSDLFPHLRKWLIFLRVNLKEPKRNYLRGASRRSLGCSPRLPHRRGLALRTKFAWSSSSKAAVIDRQHAMAVVAATHQMRLFLIFELDQANG